MVRHDSGGRIKKDPLQFYASAQNPALSFVHNSINTTIRRVFCQILNVVFKFLSLLYLFLFTKMSLSFLFLLRFASLFLLCHVTNYFHFCIIEPRPCAEELFQVWVRGLGSYMHLRRKFDHGFFLSFFVIFGAWSWNRLASDGIWKISISLSEEWWISWSRDDNKIKKSGTFILLSTSLHTNDLSLYLHLFLPDWLPD